MKRCDRMVASVTLPGGEVWLLPLNRVNLGDETARELDDCRFTPAGSEWAVQDRNARSLPFHERIGQHRNLIARGLTTVGIWQAAIGHQHYHRPVHRGNAYPAILIRSAPNLHTRRVRVVRHYLPV